MAGQSNFAWDTDAAAHLLRRAGFGGTPEEAEALAAAGLEGAVERLLADEGRDLPSPPATDPSEFARRRELKSARRREDEAARRELGMLNRAMKENFDSLRSSCQTNCSHSFIHFALQIQISLVRAVFMKTQAFRMNFYLRKNLCQQ